MTRRGFASFGWPSIGWPSIGWVVWLFASTVGPAPAQDYRLYFGTYTGAGSEGIYTATFDGRTGKVGAVELAVATEQPSFVALHPSGKYLLAVNETVEYEGEPSGSISSFAIGPDGKLEFLNRRATHGGAPCHLVITPDGRHVLAANYVGGNVVVLPIAEDGTLGEVVSNQQHEGRSVDPGRQQEPHAHSVNLSPDGRFAIAADLGTDRLYVSSFDADTGALTARPDAALAIEPGSGPRHFAFHPDRRHAFVINEMASTLDALRWRPDAGRFEHLQSISTLLPDGRFGNSTAEVVVHPSGRFVYGSNRGLDTIAMFRWNADREQLVELGQQPIDGSTPRNFVVDPSGRFLLAAGQDSDSVTVFEIDPEAGTLTQRSRVDVPRPVCIRFLPLVDRRE